MEGPIALVVLIILLIVGGSIAGIVAAVRSARLSDEIERLKQSMSLLRQNVRALQERLGGLPGAPSEKKATRKKLSEKEAADVSARPEVDAVKAKARAAVATAAATPEYPIESERGVPQ